LTKLMFFDFTCSGCSAQFEDMIDCSEKSTSCPECGATANRQVSPVRIDRTAIAMTKGASPESIAHFDRIHRQRRAIEDKAFERNGDYGRASGA